MSALNTGGALMDIVSFAIKVRKAKGSTDRLDHIDVFVGLAGVLSVLARRRRQRNVIA
ncbi:hypothetical protein [Haloactinopolyspora sp.]|uniref:hypothetical protein n=1 Tax=Haloactinopolyspora sp. TaxID=1966353 RepID=UPI00260BCF49|nr:hypothetical protein [Haloactinopolyspora sp.]